VSRDLTQRELRNESGEIMRALDAGEVFVVTRNGVVVGELTPTRRRFVSRDAALVAFSAAAPLDPERWRADWTATPPRIRRRVPDRPQRGLLDTSLIIGLERVDPDALPEQVAIAAITLAELAAGPHATPDITEAARRQQRLQLAEATFDALPFDADCARARAYGLIYAETVRAGRTARGARAVDRLIAATAMAADLPLYTANPADFGALGDLIDVRPVSPANAQLAAATLPAP
jgi:predicted nucleic acid-binding protein/antitoxin (DNA-binding transcriptional repressor) of toxin-antitoxin stability system